MKDDDSMFIPLDDDHYPDSAHGDTVQGKIHEDEDGSRWLQQIPTAKDSGIMEKDIKSAEYVKPEPKGGGGKSFNLDTATDSLMNSIKKYNKTYYSDEE